MTSEPIFPLERILNLGLNPTTEEYCITANCRPVGVHVAGYVTDSTRIIETFAKKVPPNAEVVLGYRVELAGCDSGVRYVATGTAFVPSEKIPKPTE